MSPAVKGVAFILVPVLVGGYPMYEFLMRGHWPDLLVSWDDGEVITGYSSSNFVYENARYFSSPDEKNKWWWDRVFSGIEETDLSIKKLFGDTATGNEDKKIEEGYGNSDEKSLNKVCEKIYKVDKSKLDSTGGDGKYIEDSVWKYCSPLNKKPKTIQNGDSDGGTDKLKKTKKDKLIDIDHEDNVMFWQLQEKRLFKLKLEKFSSDNSPFKRLRLGTGSGSVQSLCKTSYEETDGNVSNYKADVYQFCSFSGKES